MLDKAILKTEATNETDATDDRAEVERVERIEAERQLQEVLEIQEKERSRYILERMDWDKNLTMLAMVLSKISRAVTSRR